ncbi:MAG: hypothetical protein LBE62_03985 [Azonexus sp.]|jgi:uncharacterized membrane protein YjjP (DUF1212 family)|nr:hypothetical protein [Azonexus sp.]
MSSPPLDYRRLGRVARYALAAVFGLFCVVVGGSWFVVGRGAIVGGFPNALAEAAACLAGGVAVMGWAIVRCREAGRRR